MLMAMVHLRSRSVPPNAAWQEGFHTVQPEGRGLHAGDGCATFPANSLPGTGGHIFIHILVPYCKRLTSGQREPRYQRPINADENESFFSFSVLARQHFH